MAQFIKMDMKMNDENNNTEFLPFYYSYFGELTFNSSVLFH